jgi:hypothetical protein
MKVVLKLELFGEDQRQYTRMWSGILDMCLGKGWGVTTIGSMGPSSWVAEITGLDPKYKFARTFLRGSTDYSESNSVGSRGVFRYFVLDEGHTYDVKSQETWKRSERYYCTVREGKIVELNEDEVRECLNARLA